MMHNNILLEGHIKSIGFGIAKQDGSLLVTIFYLTLIQIFNGSVLLSVSQLKVMRLDKVPEDLQLRVGMTASIKIIK